MVMNRQVRHRSQYTIDIEILHNTPQNNTMRCMKRVYFTYHIYVLFDPSDRLQ